MKNLRKKILQPFRRVGCGRTVKLSKISNKIDKDGFVFIDAHGDTDMMNTFVENAKKSGRSDEMYVLDFSDTKNHGSLNPLTGEFTPSNI